MIQRFLHLTAWCAIVVCHPVQGALDGETEALIDQLSGASEPGCGYGGTYRAFEFLPDPGSTELLSFVLGTPAPTPSPSLTSIVKRGVAAVPSLLKHLDDGRETKIPPMKGMMWTSFSDEYDYNIFVRTSAPKGVNRNDEPQRSTSHVVTVGDLCFVALGQIMNRNFNACRYQASGGLVVNSPTTSKQLCAAARADFEGMTEQRHLKLLTQDFIDADQEFRRNGACRRLALYYPEALEPLVLMQLAVPAYGASWNTSTKARMIEALTRDRSTAIDRAIYEIFHQSGEDDYLALACMRHLMGRGHNEEFRSYCERKAGLGGSFSERFRKFLAEMDSIRGKP